MNYCIEGGIDFYNELYKSIENEETDENEECFISNSPLDKYHVKMVCGHRFNYIPLFKDLCNHKNKFNQMESLSNKLKASEIRCPYCRNRQTVLLPFYPELGLPKEHGINWFNESKNTISSYSHSVCQSMCKEHDIFGNVVLDVSGNPVMKQCSNYGYYRYMLKNKYQNENKYCTSHYTIVLNEYKEKAKEEAKKAKEETKKAKEEAKEQVKAEAKKVKAQAKAEAKAQAKAEAKAQAKEEAKAQAKEEAKAEAKAKKDNTVLKDSILIIPYTEEEEQEQEKEKEEQEKGCCAILKSGSRKGQKCGCKITEKEMCKRHVKELT